MINSFKKEIIEPVGLLDSGVGGLSVLAQLYKLMPYKNYIFFGDTKNLPYGTKTPEEIYQFTKEILDFFITKNVKNVVIACNTTSAVAYDKLKNNFEGRLNIYPLIQHAAKYALENLKNNDTIAILATKATVKVDYDKSIRYGTFVELGARGRPGNPFLRNAVDKNLDRINDAIVTEISKAVGREL